MAYSTPSFGLYVFLFFLYLILDAHCAPPKTKQPVGPIDPLRVSLTNLLGQTYAVVIPEGDKVPMRVSNHDGELVFGMSSRLDGGLFVQAESHQWGCRFPAKELQKTSVDPKSHYSKLNSDTAIQENLKEGCIDKIIAEMRGMTNLRVLGAQILMGNSSTRNQKGVRFPQAVNELANYAFTQLSSFEHAHDFTTVHLLGVSSSSSRDSTIAIYKPASSGAKSLRLFVYGTGYGSLGAQFRVPAGFIEVDAPSYERWDEETDKVVTVSTADENWDWEHENNFCIVPTILGKIFSKWGDSKMGFLPDARKVLQTVQ